VEEFRKLLCLILADGLLSGKNLRNAALGAEHGPQILGGEVALL
jgi:hypothetical protein